MRVVFGIVLLVLISARAGKGAAGGASGEDLKRSNNPLTPAIGVNLQDQYIFNYYGLPDSDSNAVLLRGTIPHKLFGWPQIVRLTVPIVTSPDEPLGSETGLGDINFLDLLLFKAGRVALGAGPQITIRSATNEQLGTGKWQAGGAVFGVVPQPWGLLGGLVTYQHSFAGDGDRPTQNTLQTQPFVIVNLPAAFYVRSTATWNFDLERGFFSIPFGLGVPNRSIRSPTTGWRRTGSSSPASTCSFR